MNTRVRVRESVSLLYVAMPNPIEMTEKLTAMTSSATVNPKSGPRPDMRVLSPFTEEGRGRNEIVICGPRR